MNEQHITRASNSQTSECRLPVATAAFGEVEIALRVIAPEHCTGTVLFCVPGMSYGRRYFDMPVSGYSFAEAAVAAGHVVVSVDNLGTGESSAPAESDAVTLQAMAAANGAVAEQLIIGLRSGNLIPGLAPVPVTATIGIGHSLGGCLALLQQAQFRSFDALCVQGFSNAPLEGIYEQHPREAELTDEERIAWAAEHLPPKLWGPTWDELDGYFTLPRENFTDLFYADDVPQQVIAADDALATRVPRVAALQTTIPYVSAPAAAEIDVPVLIAFGEVDLAADPLAEVRTYPRAPEITLLRLAGSAHCHNLASTRTRLWQRLLAWAPGAALA